MAFEAHQIDVNGYHFPSLTAAAHYFGLKRTTIYNRIRNGEDPNALSTFRPKNQPLNCRYCYHGRRYNSLNLLAKQEGLRLAEVRQAVKQGQNLDDVQPVGVTVGQQHFHSRQAACQFYKISNDTVTARILRRHEDPTDPHTYRPTKPRRDLKAPLTIAGHTFSSLSAACRYYHVDVQMVTYRVYEKGESLTDPRTYRPANEPLVKKYSYHGRRYNSMAALAKAEKINVKRIARAVKNHEKLDDLRPLGPIINGQRFASVEAACQHFGVKVSTVRARINRQHEDRNDPATYRPPYRRK